MDVLGLIVQLIIATSASWGRMFVALIISAFISILVGIWMATHENVERLLLPILDVFQTLPILTFFPFAIIVFVLILPHVSNIGVNVAVIFLIITSMLWNMIFGVYEAIKTMPKEFFELSALYKLRRMQRIRLIFFPGALPRLVEQSILSWSIGLFYLVTSEIFSGGGSNYHVTYGIGVELVKLVPTAAAPSLLPYVLAIAVFIVFVVLTRFLFFKPLENYARRYTKITTPVKKTTIYERSMRRWIGRHLGYTTTGIKVGPINLNYRTGVSKTKEVVAVAKPKSKPIQVDPKIVYSIILVALAIVAVYFVFTDPSIIPTEKLVLIALASSFARVWIAFALIVAVAVPVSIYLIFISKKVGRYLTLFQVMSSIPATVLLPLIVSSLKGQGELVAFIIFFLSGLWYVIFSMLSNGLVLPNTIFEVKKIFGVKGVTAWKDIYIKALLPGLITGGLTGIAAEWNASIVAEYFTSAGAGVASSGVTTFSGCLASQSSAGTLTTVGTGIGKFLNCSLAFNDITAMVLAIISMTTMIIIVNTLVWKRFYKNISKIYR